MTTLSVEPGYYARPKNETFRNQSTTLRARLGEMGIFLVPTQPTAAPQSKPAFTQLDLHAHAAKNGYFPGEVTALMDVIKRAWQRNKGTSRASSPDQATDAILASAVSYRNDDPNEQNPEINLKPLSEVVPYLAERGYPVGNLTVRLVMEVSADSQLAF
jgi:hypothetical protein